MKIYIITRNNLPVGAYPEREAAREVALAAATKGVKFTDHAWKYLVGVDSSGRQQCTEGGPSSDRVELWYRTGRRWIDSGYVIDTTELHR